MVLCITSFFALAQPASAATGDILAQFTAPCFSGNGRAVAYDGSGNLYYTIYGSTAVGVATVGGSCVKTIDPGVDFAALSWDSNRNVFWAGAYDGSGNVYTWDPVTNAVTLQYNDIGFTNGDGSCCSGYIDGIAYDRSTDTMWMGNDLATEIFHVDVHGNVLGTLNVVDQKSGMAFDGRYLWLSFPNLGTPVIRKYDPTAPSGSSPAPVDSFSTQGLPIEGLSFDLRTFTPKCAVWTNEATFGGDRLTAFEIPCSSTAIGDAWVLSVDTFGSGLVNELGRAYASGNASADNTTVSAAEGGITVDVASQHADSTVTSVFPGFTGTANARTEATNVDVPAILHAESIAVEVSSQANGTAASSTASGSIIKGLSILGSAPMDVPFGGTETITIPNGTVTLFEQAAGGDGVNSSELEVTAIHVVVNGVLDARIGVAWTTVSPGGGVRAHPPVGPSVTPPAPSLPVSPAPPSTNGPLGVACPAACYEPLPGDSLYDPTPVGEVDRNRYDYYSSAGGSTYGYESSYSDIATMVGSAGASDYLFDANSSGGGASSFSSVKAVNGYADTAAGYEDLTVANDVENYSYASGGTGSYYGRDGTSVSNYGAGPVGFAAGNLYATRYTDHYGSGGSTDYEDSIVDIGGTEYIYAGGIYLPLYVDAGYSSDHVGQTSDFYTYSPILNEDVPMPVALP
jgi:hypothetical protein